MHGFGNLLIVDHSESYLSIYASNESLLKELSETVAPGEPIATTGSSSSSEETGLYFEMQHWAAPLTRCPGSRRNEASVHAHQASQHRLHYRRRRRRRAHQPQLSGDRGSRDPSSLPIEGCAFTEVFGAIKTNYVEPVEDKKLITEAINGMLTGLDPHSYYPDAEAFRDCRSARRANSAASASRSASEDGFVKVISPIEDTPRTRQASSPATSSSSSMTRR